MERIKTTDEYKVGLSDYAQDSYGDFVVVEIERMNEIVDKDGKYGNFDQFHFRRVNIKVINQMSIFLDNGIFEPSKMKLALKFYCLRNSTLRN